VQYSGNVDYSTKLVKNSNDHCIFTENGEYHETVGELGNVDSNFGGEPIKGEWGGESCCVSCTEPCHCNPNAIIESNCCTSASDTSFSPISSSYPVEGGDAAANELSIPISHDETYAELCHCTSDECPLCGECKEMGECSTTCLSDCDCCFCPFNLCGEVMGCEHCNCCADGGGGGDLHLGHGGGGGDMGNCGGCDGCC